MSGLALFAGLRVADIAVSKPWYERLLGGEPSFIPNEKEAVWEFADHRSVYILEDAESPGGGLATIFLEDGGELDDRVAAIAEREIEPHERETYSNGVRKVTYRDVDGNEIGFGGPPA